MLGDAASTVPRPSNTWPTPSPPIPLSTGGTEEPAASPARSPSRSRARSSPARCRERSRVSTRKTAASVRAVPETTVVSSVVLALTEPRRPSATLAVQPVAGTPHGLQRGPFERLVDAHPQLPHVHLDDVRVTGGREVPEWLEGAALRAPVPFVPQQVLQQRDRPRPQRPRPLPPPHLVGRRVQSEVTR